MSMPARAALALLLSCGGCVSIASTIADPEPYGGVRLGGEIICDGSSTLGGVPVLVAFDLPLSILFDTLVLPYTLTKLRGSGD